jgi:hypothetical protein
LIEEVRKLRPDLLAPWMENHLRRMPPTYADCGAEEIASHLDLLCRLRRDGLPFVPVFAHMQPGRSRDEYKVVVVGQSSTGTLMCITTALALQDYCLEDVRLYTPGYDEARRADANDPSSFVAICFVKPGPRSPTDLNQASNQLVWRLTRAFRALQQHKIEYAADLVRQLSTMQPPDSADLLAIDQLLGGRFVVRQWHATGGMSMVYRAEQVSTGRPVRQVAIKVARPAHAGDGEWRERFERELRAHISYCHPHIVEVIEGQVEPDGSAWLAMEFLPSTVKERIIQRACDENLGRRWFDEALQALEYLHEDREAIHCDLKPRNLLLTENNRLKIGDFGVLRQPRLDPPIHSVGRSFPYTAPEQLPGAKPDKRWDIYALGMSFLEVFRGCTDRAELGKLPTDLRIILTRMIALDPAERYQNLCVILADLASYGR